MKRHPLLTQLEAQDWRCAYAACHTGPTGGKIKPGDDLARAYDGQALIHLACASVGVAPTPPASDRPLTDVQERVLIALAEADDREPARYHPEHWQAVDYVLPRRSPAALIRLEELGLIETHAALDREPGSWPATRGTGARITGAGRSLLLSMGD